MTPRVSADLFLKPNKPLDPTGEFPHAAESESAIG